MLQVAKKIYKDTKMKLARSISGLNKFPSRVSWLHERMNSKRCLSNGFRPNLHKEVPLEKLVRNGVEQIVLKYTSPQPGGIKVGEIAKYVKEVGDESSLCEKISQICSQKSSVGIIFDNFDGDVMANWGTPGAADAWEAYIRGFANLYCVSQANGFALHGRLLGDRVVFIGSLDADDLQQNAMKLVKEKEKAETNAKLSAIVYEHSLRLTNIMKEVTNSNLTTLFVLGGGDHAIYSCAASIKVDINRVLLLRMDRHMDERDTGLRSDPSHNAEVHPHSGNGVTQAKAEQLIHFDFLLGCDYERNNDQCLRNSEKNKKTCFTSITSIEKMRIDPKLHIDTTIEAISRILEEDDTIDYIVNIDCDTFNGIPSSAETFTGGLCPKWAYYLLEKLPELPRSPRIIRVAELHYSGDAVRRRIAVDFATEVLRSGVKSMQKFYKT